MVVQATNPQTPKAKAINLPQLKPIIYPRLRLRGCTYFRKGNLRAPFPYSRGPRPPRLEQVRGCCSIGCMALKRVWLASEVPECRQETEGGFSLSWVHRCIDANIYIYIYTYVCIYTYVYIHIYLYVYVYVYVFVYVYEHDYIHSIYIYTHTCMRPFRASLRFV